ncbi:MAG: pyruvate:ferredoxin (flavodoxin) oxidoreductase [Oscillospiraceae bacterium]|nr:pyruvate:ferredoxin (flavodoxin) oxidoreductase [Oscillospiraceae bacterium]
MARKLKTMDGNTAAAHVAYAFTDVAAIYPITPSSVMAELVDEWSAKGRKNLFDQTVRVVEMQSEGGAAGAVHGSIVSGALTTTFTASQGLLLMIPNMYKIAGEQQPAVIHVSARALASHALSIFGDHSDVMGCRSTGYAMLCANSPQEVMDLAAVAHLSTIKGRVPFLHFFDGFRTSHELQKIEVWDYDELGEMLDKDAVAAFRAGANMPAHPVLRGSAQNGDIFFQNREAANTAYNNLPAVVEEYMNEVNRRLGTDYKLFNYYGAPDATEVMVAMGSVCDAAEEVVDYLNAKGEKVGLVKVRLYRPFSIEHFAAALPETVKTVVVLDRTKEPGSIGEPLYLDVTTALARAGRGCVTTVGGRYGLGSKDTTPGAIISAFTNAKSDKPVNSFTIGITDDVTNLSLPITEEPDCTPADVVACKFWGLGSDGTVGANKNSIKIIGDHTDKKVQAYFQYDSKKSGGVTISHLRFGDSPIKSTYYVNKADFVACHAPSYIERYDIVQDIKPGGTFLLNCGWGIDELSARLPAACKKYLAENNIKFYTVDAIKIAREIGLGGRTNMILQSAFFKLSGILPIEDAVKYMKDAIVTSYGRKGEKVVNMNNAAVDAGLDSLVEITIPESWKNPAPNGVPASIDTDRVDLKKYVDGIMTPVNNMRGDALPVSAFMDMADGAVPAGAAAFEKRGIAVEVPQWLPNNCIQCGQCSLVCPHAAIRTFAYDKDEVINAPEGTKYRQLNGKGCEDYQLVVIASPMDCTGCGSCVNVCPAKNKALVMKPIDEMVQYQPIFDYAVKTTEKELPFALSTVKGTQFKKPLFEFSGACAGCGETPYAKLITQLFGDRMHIANATGCSSIWGGSAPSTPYTVNSKGQGPAWSNSLFEDNAEFGLGMLHGVTQRRNGLAAALQRLTEIEYADEELVGLAKAWLDAKDDGEGSKAAAADLLAKCKVLAARDFTGTPFEEAWLNNGKKCPCEACTIVRRVIDEADLLVKPSVWCFGGDGWAYDIGYGGLDHVIASGEDINVFVFDTEVYSNTGGQASKSTPTGAVAQFAAAGKNVKKKDLAQIAISYGYVYVAQISMGADYNQTIKAIREAEAYKGPSLIIAYAPCINHGSKNGMGKSMSTAKAAVEAGYWNLFRFNPDLEAEGKNPLSVDSKAPSVDYNDFIMSEVRYSSLKLSFPERAEELFKKASDNAATKYANLLRQQAMYEKKD